MRFRNLHRMLRLLQVRPRDHEFLAACIYTALEDIFKVVFVSLGSVVLSSEDGISEVDTDLAYVSWSTVDEGGSADRHRRSVVGGMRCPCLRCSIFWWYGTTVYLHVVSALSVATWKEMSAYWES
jgi:hypothetical protein